MTNLIPVKTQNNKNLNFGLRLSSWHGGGGSGVYSVASFLIAGLEPIDSEITRAIKELQDIDQTKHNKTEIKELNRLIVKLIKMQRR